MRRVSSNCRVKAVRVVQKADIQKVTLQVHVRIDDADEWVRPEMLAQVRFFGTAGAQSAGQANTASSAAQVVEIPARVVEGGHMVWIVDGVDGTAQIRHVELGSPSGEWVEVRSGLDISDKVIDSGRSGLQPGDHVRVEELP